MILNMVSVSGGKDSTATLLLAINRGVENILPVFADTGNEHKVTYDYLDYLEQRLDRSILRVKADFSENVNRKRESTLQKWIEQGIDNNIIESARAALQPSGNPFLDLCLWKGRFPASNSQFCTEELKIIPITNQVVWPKLKEYDQIESWQGVRWDESARRSSYVEREGIDPDATRVFAYRPILSWCADWVFDYHKRNNVKWNPLYEQGMSRVGCMPCVNSRKDEIKNIAERFPEVIDRIRQWEHCVSMASKRQSSTFFCATNDPTVDGDNVDYKTDGIDRMVDWANTLRGGRQRDLIATDAPACQSSYGLCE